MDVAAHVIAVSLRLVVDVETQPVWGLSEEVHAQLARESDRLVAAVGDLDPAAHASLARFRALADPGRALHGLPADADPMVVEALLGVKQRKPRRSLPRRVRSLPDALDWSALFSDFNRSYFMMRETDVSLDGFDLIREIAFRGAVPYDEGHDIREWEGVARVEADTGRLVEIRARPRDEDERVAAVYADWTESFKLHVGIWAGPFFIPGITIRFEKVPLTYDCHVRFDAYEEDLRLPSSLSYDVRKVIGPNRSIPRLRSDRSYPGLPPAWSSSIEADR